MSNKNYHFIIGIPRSGTSLLCFILNKNKNVLALHEPKQAAKVIKDFIGNKQNLPITKSYFNSIDDFKNVQESPYKLNNNQLNKALTFSADNNTPEKVCFNIGLSFEFLNKKNTEIETVVDKNPSYIFRIDELVQSFPNSKFIIMTRDYRGFALSKMEKSHPDNLIHKFWHQGRIWNYWHKYIFKAINKYPEQCKLVTYEDLTLSPEPTVQRICEFLDINFNQGMLFTEDLELKKHVDIASFSQRKKTKYDDLSKPINTERFEAWKTKLTDKEIAILDSLCSKYGPKLGYKPYRSTNFLNRLFYKTISLSSIFAMYVNKRIIKKI